MNSVVISVENLSKKYDLGLIGTGSLVRDFERWWAKIRGKQDPYAIIGREHVQKKKGDSILALDDVSFTVRQGEALGIIGRNGAGKSTLLKILSRVTAPTSGVVRVKGRIGSLLEVGTGFHPELTGRENVYLNGAILGMKKNEVTRKFDEIVAFSGVDKFIDTPVKRYSSGMYVRLAFAVAAHLDPEILIVDEVLAVGDAEFQKKCLGKMGDIAGEGRTILFVSHNMDAVKTLCPTSMWIDDGKVASTDKSELIIENYLQLKAKDYYIADSSLTGTLHTSRLWFSDTEGCQKGRFVNGEPIVVNIEIENPMNLTFEYEMSFWDKNHNKLWNFTHYENDIPPISGGN
ncbi:MAG: ABC transporter ATP-binding protein, partial [Anaerolineaceae bacterium]|nr:ABC transporter ATP-binding protein [Anaerolineaceae bacterium]